MMFTYEQEMQRRGIRNFELPVPTLSDCLVPTLKRIPSLAIPLLRHYYSPTEFQQDMPEILADLPIPIADLPFFVGATAEMVCFYRRLNACYDRRWKWEVLAMSSMFTISNASVADAEGFQKLLEAIYGAVDNDLAKMLEWLKDCRVVARKLEVEQLFQKSIFGYHLSFLLKKSAMDDVKAGKLPYFKISPRHIAEPGEEYVFFILDMHTPLVLTAQSPLRYNLILDLIDTIGNVVKQGKCLEVAALAENLDFEDRMKDFGFVETLYKDPCARVRPWKLLRTEPESFVAVTNAYKPLQRYRAKSLFNQ